MNSENSIEATLIQNLDEINRRQEDRIHNLETKAIQLANLYFVFQGVILSAVFSPASSLRCRQWWIPFSLSLLAAALNLFAFAATVLAYLRCAEALDQNMEDLASASAAVRVLDSPTIRRTTKPDRFRRARRRVFAVLGVAIFVGFSGIVLFGCRVLLCPSSSGDRNL